MEIKLTEKQSDLLQKAIDKFHHIDDLDNPMRVADKSIQKEDGRYIHNDNYYHNGWGRWELCETSLTPIIDVLESMERGLLNHWSDRYKRHPLMVCNNLLKKLKTAREGLV
jgi:hypothetical protein